MQGNLDDDDDDDHVNRAMISAAIAVKETAPLDDVCARLLDARAPAVAVVDDDGGLVGVITRTDLLRAIADRGDAATAADAMSRFVLVLPLGVPVERAAALMAFESVGQVVVTDEHGDVAGMLTALDVARHCARRAGYLIEH
jgi:CBS domain-containing protein